MPVRETVTIDFKAKGHPALIKALNNLAKAQAKVTKSHIPLNTNVKKTTGALNRFSGAGARASSNVRKLAASNQLMGGTLSVIRSKLLIYTFAFTAFNKVLFETLKASGEQQKAELKLASVLKTTGRAVGLTATELKSYARSVAETTEFSDELVMSAEAMLLTFTKIQGETFKEALTIAADMSVVFGQDLKSSVIQVGKALNDPAKGFTALRRIGVSFSVEQEKLIKGFIRQNDLAAAQRVILDELQVEFGGVASSVGKSAITVAHLANAWGDFMEVFGDTVAPVVAPALQSLTDFFNFFQSDLIKTEAQLRKWGATEEQIKQNSIMFLKAELLASDAVNQVNLEGVKNNQDAIAVNMQMQEGLTGLIEKSSELKEGMIKANKTLSTFGLGTKEAQVGLKSYLESWNLIDLPFYEDVMNKMQVIWTEKSVEGSKKISQFFHESTDLQKKQVIEAMKLILANEEKLEQDQELIDSQAEYNKNLTEFLHLMGLIPQVVVEAQTPFEKFWKDNKQSAELLVSSFSNMTSALQGELSARMKSELDTLKASDKYKRASTEQQKKMEADKTKEFAKERKRLWLMEKTASLGEAGINIATAITKALPNVFLASLVGAMGAVQLAAIAGTKPPKFAQGGLVGGRRHSQGGTMIEAEQGEFVMNRSAVESVGIESLNRINQGGGGSVTVNVSGNVLTQDFVEQDLAEAIKEAARRGTDFGIS